MPLLLRLYNKLPVPRGDVVLTVTEKTITRDAVAIGFGMLFSPDATLEVVAGSSSFEFYTASRTAFARDGHAALVAFERSDKIIARSQGSGPSRQSSATTRASSPRAAKDLIAGSS